jgi:integrase
MFRDGLIFMLLSSVPVRLRNLTMIKIGRHLILAPDRPGFLQFTAKQTKGKRHARFSLWPELRAVIDEYIAVYRPVLAGIYEGKALWLCQCGGGPLKSAGLYAAIVRITTLCAERLGGPVNPHFFRDAIATALIERYPDKPEYATTMLQHRHRETTREYQEMAKTIYAAQRLAEILETARDRFANAA